MHPNDGKNCSIQLRVRVLSTQHHGSNFLLKFRLSEGDKIIETFSQPIKTHSKLDPIRRKIAEQTGAKVATTDKKKRARSDELLETLEEIKETQSEQSRMISSLLMALPIIPENRALPNSELKPTAKLEPKIEPLSLEDAIERLLEAYHKIEEDERPHKLRRIVSSLPTSGHQQTLHEVGYVLSTPTDPELPHLEQKFSPPVVGQNSSGTVPQNSFVESSYLPTDSLDSTVASPDNEAIPLSCPPPFSADALQYPSSCVHLKELELWNTVLHDLLTEDDE